MVEFKLEIDISGQVQQINYDSVLGFKRNDWFERSVYLDKRIKKEIMRKYKGQVINLVEKLDCILIYYCIGDEISNINEIKICKDVNFRRIKNLLPLLFKKQDYLSRIKISKRKGDEKKSAGFYTTSWNGCNKQGTPAASGIYLCQIRTKQFTQNRKMLLMR